MMLQRFGLFAMVFSFVVFAMVGQTNAAVVSVQLVDNNDDAEESLGPAVTLPPPGNANADSVVGAVSLGSSDLELGSDFRTQGGGAAEWRQLIGLRFPGVAIPVGATINSASIQFQVDELDKGAGSPTFTISGEASSNAAPFTAANFNLSGTSINCPSR